MVHGGVVQFASLKTKSELNFQTLLSVLNSFVSFHYTSVLDIKSLYVYIKIYFNFNQLELQIVLICVKAIPKLPPSIYGS